MNKDEIFEVLRSLQARLDTLEAQNEALATENEALRAQYSQLELHADDTDLHLETILKRVARVEGKHEAHVEAFLHWRDETDDALGRLRYAADTAESFAQFTFKVTDRNWRAAAAA